MACFFGSGELYHPVGEINADDGGRAAMTKFARVIAFATGQVQDGQSLKVANQPQQGVPFDEVTPRLLLRAFVIAGDFVVICSQDADPV
jgi:hypothetical protein